MTPAYENENPMEPQLPFFDNPPVVETVLGVQFAPIENWSLLDFGLLWSELKDDYPDHETKPPVGVPDFGEVIFPFNVDDQLDNQLPLRLWLKHKSDKKLIQIQADRFVHNWRKYVSGQPYPRYSNPIRPSFELEWTRFTSFLSSRNMSIPSIHSCEIAYVNRFEQTNEWNELSDLPKIVNLWAGSSSSDFLPNPSTVTFQTIYPLGNIKEGRLSITCQPVSEANGVRSIRMILQVSGQVESNHLETILNFFDLGHEWIVKTFAEITTSSMHNLWQRQD